MFRSCALTLSSIRPWEGRREQEEVRPRHAKAQRERLRRRLIWAGTASARMLIRARILLKADIGEHVEGRPTAHRRRDRPDARACLQTR